MASRSLPLSRSLSRARARAARFRVPRVLQSARPKFARQEAERGLRQNTSPALDIMSPAINSALITARARGADN